MTAKCKVCRAPFAPRLPMQTVCSMECAKSLAVSVRGKLEKQKAIRDRKADKIKRESLKSRADWAREAQSAVNAYVRIRDAALGCVSCDRPASWDGQWHASHFRSVGAASSVRFNLWNIHKSCSVCNNWKSGNLIEYEPRLKKKIGAEKVDWLRTQNQLVTYSIEYLARLKGIFSKRSRRLEGRAA